MKYRRLTTEELEELKPEFINFLASNQITADEWERLKKIAPEKVDQLIDIFSDIVLEKALSRIEYVEYREKNSVMVFNFREGNIALAGLTISKSSDLDLTRQEDILRLSSDPRLAASLQPEIFSVEKPYQQARPVEVFKLLQSGALISDDRLFKLLNELKNPT